MIIGEKVAFTTTVTKSRLVHLRALLNSLKINSPSVSAIPFICFTGDNSQPATRKKAKGYGAHVDFDTKLNKKDRSELKSLYPSVEVRDIKIDLYEKHLKFTPFFWRIDAFNMSEFDKVIFFDADMLCINDVSGLLDIECDIGVTEQTEGMRDWNWGLFMVGKNYLTSEMYDRVISFKHDMTQPAEPMHMMTKLFGDHLYEIPQSYNKIVPQLAPGEALDYEVLHYIYKPFTDLERLIQPEYLKLWKTYSV